MLAHDTAKGSAAPRFNPTGLRLPPINCTFQIISDTEQLPAAALLHLTQRPQLNKRACSEVIAEIQSSMAPQPDAEEVPHCTGMHAVLLRTFPRFLQPPH